LLVASSLSFVRDGGGIVVAVVIVVVGRSIGIRIVVVVAVVVVAVAVAGLVVGFAILETSVSNSSSSFFPPCRFFFVQLLSLLP